MGTLGGRVPPNFGVNARRGGSLRPLVLLVINGRLPQASGAPAEPMVPPVGANFHEPPDGGNLSLARGLTSSGDRSHRHDVRCCRGHDREVALAYARDHAVAIVVENELGIGVPQKIGQLILILMRSLCRPRPMARML
jgi:hypothetical protein